MIIFDFVLCSTVLSVVVVGDSPLLLHTLIDGLFRYNILHYGDVVHTVRNYIDKYWNYLYKK